MIGGERLIRVVDSRQVGVDDVVAAEPWMEAAACGVHEHGPELWYPEAAKGQSLYAMSREAIGVCHECPVRVECLFLAVDRRERFGIWGGHNMRSQKGHKAALQEAATLRKETA